jgi:DNA modification methylase
MADPQFDKNMLFYGDNLEIMRHRIADESVDLCYIDPPFNSNRSYFQIYSGVHGKVDKAQAQAFTDTWTCDDSARAGFDEITTNVGGRFTKQVIELIKGLEQILGNSSDLLAYLVHMTLRVTEIFRVLKPTGSFYLHCDPTASHYLKLVLDAVFVSQGGDYMNDITWKRSDTHNDAKRQFPAVSDHILFYRKPGRNTFHQQYVGHAEKTLHDWYIYLEFSDGTVRRMTKQEKETQTIPAGARRFNADNMASPNPRPNLMYEYKGYSYPVKGWRYSRETMEKLDREGKLLFPSNPNGRIMFKRYLDEQSGATVGDVWTDISQLRSSMAERMGYPTQKPEALLERIIEASSNEGDVVLDAYCGCGTTIAVAQRLNRKWIGIDITYHSISLMLKRLTESFGESVLEKIVVEGIPRDLESASALANRQDDRVRKEFEKWAALTYTNNRGAINEKKGADKGIDAVVYFAASSNETGRMIIQVKSGGVNRGTIATLRGDMERERADMATLITLENPTMPMIDEAKHAGFYEHAIMGKRYDRIQIVTVQEMIEQERRIDLPLSFDVLKQAAKSKDASQLGLGIG